MCTHYDTILKDALTYFSSLPNLDLFFTQCKDGLCPGDESRLCNEAEEYLLHLLEHVC